MRRLKKKVQPVRTLIEHKLCSRNMNLNVKSTPYSSTYILLLISTLICAEISLSEAACPTIFFAQAIGQTKAATMDFYYTRTGVPSTAECANFCGFRQFCRTAVYNHDARTCALSYEKAIECSTTKQRYNTFHLTTDGADSLSMLTCIDPCKKAFVGNAPVSTTPPKTLFNLGRPDTIEKGASPLPITSPTSGAESTALQPIVPVNHPAHSTNGSSSFQGHGITSLHSLEPSLQNIFQRLASVRIRMEQQEKADGFLDAIQQLNKMNEKLAQKEKEEASKVINKSNTAIELKPAEELNQTVTFNGMPLHIQEMFNGATNAQDAMSRQLAKGDATVIRTLQNGTESKVHTGGLFKWLKPGESLVIDPPLSHPSANFLQSGFKLDALKGKIPVKLVTIAPEAFERTTIAPDEAKRTLTAASRIKVEERNKDKEGRREGHNEKEEIVILKKKSQAEPNIASYTKEPIVVNGHILTQQEVGALLDKEKTSSTTTTTVSPWQPAGLIGEEGGANGSVEREQEGKGQQGGHKPAPLQDEQGFLNTFLIQGLSTMFHKSDDQRKDLDKVAMTTTTTTAIPLTSTTTSPTVGKYTKGPIICYRYVPQQRLLYAEFKRGRGFTLNECRCACAETWRNESSTDKSNTKSGLCKSLSFNEDTGECSLNKADHTGKYDLIFDKKVDYHYVSCDIPYLLNTAAKMCQLSSTEGSTTSAEAKPQQTMTHPSTEPTSRAVTSSTPSIVPKSTAKPTTQAATTSTAKQTRTTATPKSPSTTKATPLEALKSRDKSNSSAKIHGTTVIKSSTVKPKASTTAGTVKTTSSYNKLIKEEEPINKEEPDLLIAETTTILPKLATVKLIRTNFTESSSMLVSSEPIKMGEMVTITLTEDITTSTTSAATSTTTSSTSTTTTTTAAPVRPTTEQSLAVRNAKVNGCFEVIEGYVMNNTAGGLERDVSMEECQCFCANSLTSKRYSFQCTSATYYHKERDCILNLSNRQLTPEIFVENDQQQRPESALTYLGLICNPTKAVAQHANQSFLNGCTKASIKEETLEATTSPAIKSTTPTAHTDECFLELPNHVLEGTALAIETNVTVDQCKCYCVDSEHRYGTSCQSMQYYFDSQTCLLNKENRISDPDRFNYDPESNVMHSYFDYRCHVEKLVLSAYIEQVCQMIIDVSVKDAGGQTKANNSLNIDDKSTEATKGTKVMDDAKLKKLDTPAKSSRASVDAGKKASTLSRKTRTTTSAPTTTTTPDVTASPSTTTATTKKDEDDSEDDDEGFTELKFESSGSTISTRAAEDGTTTTTTTTATPKNVKAITVFRKKNKKQQPKTIIPELEEESEEDDKAKEKEKTKMNDKKKEDQDEEEDEDEEVDNETHNQKNDTSLPSNTTTSTTEAALSTKSLLTSTLFPMRMTTTPFPYSPVGPCRYSALYQTIFYGGRLIKKIPVASPAQCFAACHAERCRSANLVQYDGNMKSCELFKDSIVEFRRTDVLSFDRSAVHFDSIQCDEA